MSRKQMHIVILSPEWYECWACFCVFWLIVQWCTFLWQISMHTKPGTSFWVRLKSLQTDNCPAWTCCMSALHRTASVTALRLVGMEHAEECSLLSAVAEWWNYTWIDKQKKLTINLNRGGGGCVLLLYSFVGKVISSKNLTHIYG